MWKFNIETLGTVMSAVFVVVAALMVYARNGAVKAFTAIKTSFVAIVSSPAVWLAVGLTFVGGYWLGHMHGAFGKRALRGEIATLKVDVKSAKEQGHADAKGWKDKAEAAQKQISLLKSSTPPKSAPVAAVSRRAVPKRARTTKVVSEPAKPFWPFP